MRHKHVIALAAVALAGSVAPAGASAETTVASKCVQNSAGEFGTRYCIDTDGSCIVSEYRWGGVEGTYTCLVSRP